jgi:hypothetical protein
VRDLAVLFLHPLATVARLADPGCARAVVAESVLVKQQLLILQVAVVDQRQDGDLSGLGGFGFSTPALLSGGVVEKRTRS